MIEAFAVGLEPTKRAVRRRRTGRLRQGSRRASPQVDLLLRRQHPRPPATGPPDKWRSPRPRALPISSLSPLMRVWQNGPTRHEPGGHPLWKPVPPCRPRARDVPYNRHDPHNRHTASEVKYRPILPSSAAVLRVSWKRRPELCDVDRRRKSPVSAEPRGIDAREGKRSVGGTEVNRGAKKSPCPAEQGRSKRLPMAKNGRQILRRPGSRLLCLCWKIVED
jgi:hypothetical protein